MIARVLARDGTIKFVFDPGGERVFEAAYFHIPGRERPYIACVSTQLGCAVRCGFCTTRETGLVRQLTADEITTQISAVTAHALKDGAREPEIEISFMGMGEPLANRSALIAAIENTHRLYPLISRVSVSTVGPSSRIRAFIPDAMSSPIPIHLQISLHATQDEVRHHLVPGVHDTIDKLLEAGAMYSTKTDDHVCLNYVLLADINDSNGDAQWLAMLDPDTFYIKLTHLNEVPELAPGIKPASPERFEAFTTQLMAADMPFKVFRGDGLDVRASCGQLAAAPIAVYRSAQFAPVG